jgi:hypothetical protein
MNPEQFDVLMQHISKLTWEQCKLRDSVYQQQSQNLAQQHTNPLVKYGSRAFSQNNEDGITLEILRRLNITKGTYAEFGVGDGMENNTLVLAALGWRGFWCGGDQLAWIPKPTDLWRYYREWITRPNIAGLAQQGCEDLGIDQLDVISLDLDGVDLHLVAELLENGVKPQVWVVEYNAHFPPPMEFTVKYSDQHKWTGNDYFGASLQTYTLLMQDHGYELICCEAEAGANAWFVLREHRELFPEVPTDIRDIYSPPRYYGHNHLTRHPRSIDTVQQILNQD